MKTSFNELKQKALAIGLPVLMHSEYCKKHRVKGIGCNTCESDEGCGKMVEIGLQHIHKMADIMGKEKFLEFWEKFEGLRKGDGSRNCLP